MTQRVLVVDDEENIRHTLSLMLKKEGYRVDVAENGARALSELEAHEYDAVLCDVRMPEMNGMALLEELRNRRVVTTVIMMSAYGDLDDALAAIKAGAWDYLTKPFRKEQVLFALDKAREHQQLREQNASLKQAARRADGFAGMLARSEPMRKVFDTIRKVADYKSTVLISGESGTGKEMVARALHFESIRAEHPFVTVNCGAIPEQLLESELFGHVKGAFTDAARDKQGLFLEANHGTIFLDEIGDMPHALQVKLLRVLQENEVRRVGDTKVIRVDVRVVAASVHELGELVKAGRFREDLFYRLNVLPIHLPALRARPEDIALLAERFVERFNDAMGTRIRGISPQAMKVLAAYPWPGNVRELENVIERAIVLSDDEVISTDVLPDHMNDSSRSIQAVLNSDDLSIKKATRAIERVLIERALEKTGGNRTAASKLLEISHRALLYKIKDYFPEGLPYS